MIHNLKNDLLSTDCFTQSIEDAARNLNLPPHIKVSACMTVVMRIIASNDKLAAPLVEEIYRQMKAALPLATASHERLH